MHRASYRNKQVWEVILRHRPAQGMLNLGDWKGTVFIWVYLPSGVDREQLQSEVIELQDLLCSTTCPHPYDGVVAGTVA